MVKILVSFQESLVLERNRFSSGTSSCTICWLKSGQRRYFFRYKIWRVEKWVTKKEMVWYHHRWLSRQLAKERLPRSYYSDDSKVCACLCNTFQHHQMSSLYAYERISISVVYILVTVKNSILCYGKLDK